MKRNATTIAVIACLLLGALYFLQRENRVSVGMKELSLPSFDAKKIDRVLFSGKSDVILQKENDGWKVVLSEKDGVRAVPASGESVDAMLRSVGALKPERRVSERADLAASYGLGEKEGLHLQLFQSKEKVLDLWLGNADDAGGRYVRLANANDIYLVKGNFYQIAKDDAKAWREKKLIAMKPDDVKTIQVDAPGRAPIVLAHDDKSKLWNFDQSKEKLPQGFRFDSERASDFARGVSSLVALDFVDDAETKQKAAAAFAAPHTVVHLHGEKGSAEVALAKIGEGAGSKFYARVKGNDQLFEISTYVYDQATRDLDYFRSMKLWSLDPSKIKRIRFVSPKNDVIAERGEKEWSLRKPTVLPKDFVWDAAYAPTVAERLSNLRATRMVNVSAAQAGVASEGVAKARLELEDESGKKEVLLFGNAVKPAKGQEATETYVRSPGDGKVYVVSSVVFKRAENGLEYFKKPEPHGHGGGANSLQNLPPEIRKQIEAAMRH
jgi:hypothetical protein